MRPFSEPCHWSWWRSRLSAGKSISTCIIVVVGCIIKRESEELWATGLCNAFFFLFFPFFPPFNNRVIKCHNKIQTFLDKARFYFVKWVRRFWKKKIQFWRKNLISWNQVFLFCSCFCFTLAGLTLSQPIYPPFYVCSAVSAVESDMAW